MVFGSGGRRRRQHDARHPGDSGFTLIETMMAMVLFGILVGIVVGPYANYRERQQHAGATRELVAFLRRAQVRAVSEETTYRVDITAGGAASFRFNGASYDPGQTLAPSNGRIEYSGASFVQPGGGLGTTVWFYARGAGSKGSVAIVREGADKVYTVEVEGLTARVSYE